MDNTTDKGEVASNEPMSEDAAVDWLLSPEQSEEPEPETDEAPAEPTEAVDDDEDTDAPDEAEEYEDEDTSDEDEDDDAEDDDSDDDEEEQPESQTFQVKVDGKEVAVTLDELKRGYSGQAYIQKGMEENKAFQKQLAEAAQSFQQERQALLQMYQQAQSTGFKPAPQPPSRDLLAKDPIAYMEAEAAYRDDLQEYQKQQQQVQYHQQQAQRQQQAMHQKALQEQWQKLVEMAPEFGDAEKAPKVRDRLVKDAQEYYGFSAEDLEQVADARVVLALRDALAYRDLQSGKAKAKKKPEPTKSVTRPSAKRKDGGKKAKAQTALQRARKTQSDDDWVNVLLSGS